MEKPRSFNRQEILDNSPYLNAYLHLQDDHKVWESHLLKLDTEIDGTFKEKFGANWTDQILVPQLILAHSMMILDPSLPRQTKNSLVKGMMFMGYELEEKDRIQAFLKEIVLCTGKLGYLHPITYADVRESLNVVNFFSGVLNVGAYLKKVAARENPLRKGPFADFINSLDLDNL